MFPKDKILKWFKKKKKKSEEWVKIDLNKPGVSFQKAAINTVFITNEMRQ